MRQPAEYPPRGVLPPARLSRGRYLAPGRSFEHLDELAHALSDHEAARQLDEARERLFESIHNAHATAA